MHGVSASKGLEVAIAPAKALTRLLLELCMIPPISAIPDSLLEASSVKVQLR